MTIIKLLFSRKAQLCKLFIMLMHSVVVSLQLMVTGVRGSRGGSALLPVEVEREHVSDCVTAHFPVTEAGHAQETPHSSPGVTLRPAQVSCLFRKQCKCEWLCMHLIHINIISICQVGPRRHEAPSSATLMILNLASPSSMAPSQTANPVAESSKLLFLTYQGH